MNTYINTGLLFNKHYFKDLIYNNDFKNDSTNKNDLEEKNKILTNTELNNPNPLTIGTHQIKLNTIYPGLFLGSGYAHESGVLGEFKLGFFFDHTTGLPILPGSSVKGILKSAFDKATENFGEKNKKLKASIYVQELLQEITSKSWSLKDIYTLEQTIFEGDEKLSLYQRDIFFDAFPVGVVNSGKFLGNDYITPHLEPLKDPTPLQFLKVLPNVEFQFNFKLTNSGGLDAKLKLLLFKQILLDLGIGAKTNVGYGQFDLSSEEKDEQKQNEAEQKQKQAIETRKAELAEIERQEAEVEANKTEAEKRILKGEVLECRVSKIDNKKKGSCFFKFDWDNELEFRINKQKLKIELKSGDIVKIEIIDDYFACREVRFLNSITKE